MTKFTINEEIRLRKKLIYFDRLKILNRPIIMMMIIKKMMMIKRKTNLKIWINKSILQMLKNLIMQKLSMNKLIKLLTKKVSSNIRHK